MEYYSADLHIHSPYSIAVSKSLNLDTMVDNCRKKGLRILATGDILQPDWLKYMKNNLEIKNKGTFFYKGIYFILQSEIEDKENIHHVVLFPDFINVEEVQKKLASYSKNLYGEWGGRPRVNLASAEIVDMVTDSGAIIGPAHAFTPFKSIFRHNKYKTLEECYESTIKKVSFLELGLSANTDLADRLESLKDVTFLSNSDAHSENVLGREFNKFYIEMPTFEEIQMALMRKSGRKITLNVGLHPKLGKYYNMFCSKCRRRIIFKNAKKDTDIFFNQYSITPNFITYYSNHPEISKQSYIDQVAKDKMICPACLEENKKNFKIKLGVSERIDIISSFKEPHSPKHRPPYINAIPLIDIIRSVKKIKSYKSKTVLDLYDKMVKDLGTEFEILVDISMDILEKYDSEISMVIKAFRNNEIEYSPGGGGTYGQIKIDI